MRLTYFSPVYRSVIRSVSGQCEYFNSVVSGRSQNRQWQTRRTALTSPGLVALDTFIVKHKDVIWYVVHFIFDKSHKPWVNQLHTYPAWVAVTTSHWPGSKWNQTHLPHKLTGGTRCWQQGKLIAVIQLWEQWFQTTIRRQTHIRG